MIACVRLPHFAASVEERAHPDLKGKAVALVDAVQIPATVYSVSELASRVEVRPGMTVPQAKAQCRVLDCRPAVPSRYRETLGGLLEAFTTFTPNVEAEEGIELRADSRQRTRTPFLHPSQMDNYPAATCYLDLGKLKPDAAQIMADQIHQCVKDHMGRSAKLGLASGKFPARVAAAAVNEGEILLIPNGQEAAFLAVFTAALLPVDGETLRQLDLLGLYTLDEIAKQPVSALLDRFGKLGRVMHRLANGQDTSRVRAYVPPVINRMTRHLDGSITRSDLLKTVLSDMVAELAGTLFEGSQTVRQITLLLTQDDGITLERYLALRQPSANVQHLFETIVEMTQSLPVSAGIVQVELLFSGIEAATPKQLSLFERQAVPEEYLNTALNNLIARYGDGHFYWLCAVNANARLPERRFRWEKAEKK